MSTQTSTRLHRCRCVIVDDGLQDRCPAQVPLDAPFCEQCEQHHQGRTEGRFGVVPVGQP